MGNHLSQGTENLVRALSTWGRREGTATFPARMLAEVPRAKGTDGARHWFIQAVKTALDGDPAACALEPGLGLFASIRWKNGHELTFVKLHAIICAGTLEDLYFDESKTPLTYYLRLDYDLSALGELFSHPHPHVHTTPWPKFALRFPPEMSETGNVVMDFVDFLYRSFFHTQWMGWARDTWALKLKPDEDDPFDFIDAAFRSSKAGVLLQEPYASVLVRMKHAWRESRDSLFPLRIPRGVSRLLSPNL